MNNLVQIIDSKNVNLNIDNLNINNNKNLIRGGFGIQVNDIENESNFRNLLYLDNNSELTVNSIKLGGHTLSVDGNGNLLFDGKIVNTQ
jgi:hypothetical protein